MFCFVQLLENLIHVRWNGCPVAHQPLSWLKRLSECCCHFDDCMIISLLPSGIKCAALWVWGWVCMCVCVSVCVVFIYFRLIRTSCRCTRNVWTTNLSNGKEHKLQRSHGSYLSKRGIFKWNIGWMFYSCHKAGKPKQTDRKTPIWKIIVTKVPITFSASCKLLASACWSHDTGNSSGVCLEEGVI